MKKLLQKIGFDSSEAQFFAYLYKSLSNQEQKELEILGEEFSKGKGIGTANAIQEKLKPLAEKYQLQTETANLLFLVANLENIRQKYLKKGIEEEIFIDTLKDLKYKLDECKKYHGLLGVRPFWWYIRFMNADIVALGRFQYETIPFFEGLTYEWGDIKINPGDAVINFHIPSSGPMPREARIESYKKAFQYFGKKKGEYLPIVCLSWLIYPGYKEVYAEGSNMYDFLDDFAIIHESKEADETFRNSWTVFGCEFKGDTSRLPDDTALQKSFIRHLNAGKSTGWGTGVILFDGEKIVNNKRDNEN
ncbi:MAG: DUF5596 domain-containing protein [Clostridia bacterium]|nr:DUF5596 domain-containing protein [Clostridia bacterium]